MRIAQPFKVGCARPKKISPEGTAESRVFYERSVSRPFGTCSSAKSRPNLERLGYSRISLREISTRALCRRVNCRKVEALMSAVLRQCRAALALLLLSTALPVLSAAPAETNSWLANWRATNHFWRGVHLSAHNDKQAATLIEQFHHLAAAGVNVVILEVDYGFEFQAHPELRSTGYITRSRAREL